MAAERCIALIAHDQKKDDMADFARLHRQTLSQYRIFATGTTGGRVLEACPELDVTRLKSGPLGGDQQIGASIAEGKIDVLIFFWDPMEAQPHDPDVKALLRVAATWNIPTACNEATADFLLTSPLMTEDYEPLLPDFSAYLNRKITS